MTSSPAESKASPPSRPADGEPCPNCGSQEAWGSASWCPDCGYYPALGGTSLRSAKENEGNGETAHAAWETADNAPANLIEAIPPWAWTAMGGAFLIFLANLGVRLLLPLKASHRTLLTLLEFSVGTLVAGTCHGMAYLVAACKSDKYGPFDFFMKPIEIWKPTFLKLPEGRGRVCGMAWGTTAVFAALFVLAGFEFAALFEDWGFEEREKPNAVHEAVERARKKGDGDEDLEGAMKEFVGEGELEDALETLETRCVIIGYTTSRETGELTSLVLGSAPRGRLAYVGLLSQADIPQENRREILTELQTVKQRKSCYVKRGVPLSKAVWVEPQILCLVEHQSWTTQYRLQQPKFLKFLTPEEAQANSNASGAKKAG